MPALIMRLVMMRPDVNEALFVSELQPSDAPTAEMMAAAIDRTVQRYGTGGCAARMAQEFGDHPDAAAERMRWACGLAVQHKHAARTRTGPPGEARPQ